MQLLHYSYLIASVMFGACIGSFINVIVYRLPKGISMVTPPSSCPGCGYKLAWYDNVPVLAWFYLKGECRKCQMKISFQYPLIEAICGLLFGVWFVICFMTNMRPDFAGAGFAYTWPPLVMYFVLWGALLAATLVDARYYIIPLTIPWVVIGAAIIVMPVSVWLLPEMRFLHPYLDTSDYGKARMISQEMCAAPLSHMGLTWFIIPVCATAGLVLSNLLVWLKVMPRSFDNLDTSGEQLDNPETWAQHPHPRREILKEGAFLALPVIGVLAGWWFTREVVYSAADWYAAIPLRALAGVLTGLLVGGGIVWITRILGTLAFGKEAMGLGDVHLMAAVGAVCGWRVAVLAFFIAPFIGLAYTGISHGVGRLLKRNIRVIPYGPHLAAATYLVAIFREMLYEKFGILLGM